MPSTLTTFLLITYDISNHRRRVKVHKLLTAFGWQVQESVFECELDDGDSKRLLKRLKQLAKPGDNIRIYPLCASCQDRIRDADGNPHPAQPEIYFG